MKTKSLALISALGLLFAVVGLYRYWAIVEVTVSFPGVYVDNRANIDAWVSFTIGCIGITLLAAVGAGYVLKKRRARNQI